MFHHHGIGEIRLGKKITDLQDVIPFRDFELAGNYIVTPGPSAFYYYTGDILNATDSVELLMTIEHVFIGVDQANQIRIIIIHFLNIQGQDIPRLLEKYFGPPISLGGAEIEGAPVRRHVFWNSADGEIQIGFSSATASEAATYPTMVYTRTRELSYLHGYTVTKRIW